MKKYYLDGALVKCYCIGGGEYVVEGPGGEHRYKTLCEAERHMKVILKDYTDKIRNPKFVLTLPREIYT